jgi:hypothetical protein
MKHWRRFIPLRLYSWFGWDATKALQDRIDAFGGVSLPVGETFIITGPLRIGSEFTVVRGGGGSILMGVASPQAATGADPQPPAAP